MRGVGVGAGMGAVVGVAKVIGCVITVTKKPLGIDKQSNSNRKQQKPVIRLRLLYPREITNMTSAAMATTERLSLRTNEN